MGILWKLHDTYLLFNYKSWNKGNWCGRKLGQDSREGYCFLNWVNVILGSQLFLNVDQVRPPWTGDPERRKIDMPLAEVVANSCLHLVVFSESTQLKVLVAGSSWNVVVIWLGSISDEHQCPFFAATELQLVWNPEVCIYIYVKFFFKFDLLQNIWLALFLSTMYVLVFRTR